MILIHTKNIILAGFTLGFLAACSGSTTTDTGGGTGGGTDECVLPEISDGEGGCYEPTAPSGVTTGTTGDISSNGLDFAVGSPINLNGIEDTEMTLRALKLVRTVDGEATTLSASLVDATITISDKHGGRDVSINFDGETAEFDYNDGLSTFTSSDGITYEFFMDKVTDTIYVITAIGTDLALPEGEQEDRLYGAFAGFETDPDFFVDNEAVASYVGDFSVLLASTTADDLAIDGVIAFSADFAGGSITGSLADGTVEAANDLTVDFSGDILGNGWNATITGINIDAEDDFSLADGGGQLDGVFYGSEGEESAGSIIIDATLTNGIDDDYDWVGGGGFVACDIAVDADCIN